MCKTSEIKTNDFIEIPALNVIGCVYDVKPSWIGGESSIIVELQTDPEKNESKPHRIEDGEFKWA